MRAIVIEETGGPEKLTLKDVAEPIPGEGEIAVRVAAAGLNFIDTYQRSGLYQVELPFTPGNEGSGTVGAVGAGVTDFAVGDRIAVGNAPGWYAEVVVVPADRAVKVPDEVTDDQGAAVMLQGMTAHYLVFDTFPLTPDNRCLVHAGAGGVGLLLTQMAKEIGATVITTVGSPEKVELSQAAGADLVIEYRKDDFAAVIEDRYGPEPLDVIYDGVGKATLQKGFPLLRKRGMMVAFGNASGPPDPMSPLELGKGSWFLTRPSLFHYVQTRAELVMRANAVFDLIAQGALDVRIGATFPLADAAEAHRALEGRQTTGKVLIKP